MAIYSGFTHWKWWFSIAMLNYQRVYQLVSWGVLYSYISLRFAPWSCTTRLGGFESMVNPLESQLGVEHGGILNLGGLWIFNDFHGFSRISVFTFHWFVWELGTWIFVRHILCRVPNCSCGIRNATISCHSWWAMMPNPHAHATWCPKMIKTACRIM